MILFCSIIFVGLLCQGAQGQFFQYFYSGLNNHYIAPAFNQPQIYYQDKNLYYTQNINTNNIEPAIRTPSKSFLPDNYRGFGYHTAYDNGATANVIFLRGGAINHLQSISTRITVASDILDPQSNTESQIRKAFEGPRAKTSSDTIDNEVSNLSHFVRALLENKQPSSFITHFYSEDYPASASDLTIATNSINKKSNNETSAINDEETAESKMQIKINDFANDTKINNENLTVTESSVTSSITTTGDFDLTSTLSAAVTTTSTTENLLTKTSVLE